MPKMKTKSSAKKRFTVTGTGKLKRKHAFKSHILTKKGTKQKRNLTQTGLVSKADTPNIKTQLGNLTLNPNRRPAPKSPPVRDAVRQIQ